MANDISTNPLGALDRSVRADAVARLRQVSSDQRPGAAEEAAREKSAQGQVSRLGEVVSGLNEMVQNLHRHLQFSVDEESGDTVIKVVDSETQQVVRQIPSEEIVQLHQRMKDAAGVLFQGAV